MADRYWKLIWSSREQAAKLYYLGDDPNELHDRGETEPETTNRSVGCAAGAWLWLRPAKARSAPEVAVAGTSEVDLPRALTAPAAGE